MNHLSNRLRQFSQATFSSLHVRNYRLYYIGQIISTSGTFMQSVAQAWLVLQLTNSGPALGLATALQYLPILFLGPYGGVIADRFSKRKILYFTQSISGILALILGGLGVSGGVVEDCYVARAILKSGGFNTRDVDEFISLCETTPQ